MDGNKRIAINTLFLYAKFIITTIVSLVISRLVLDVLGANDYGLYNVVGGIVAMLNTLGTSMVATSYRYMTVEIGKGANGNPNKVYNTLVVVHISLAALLIVLGETFGVFYVNNYLNVDPVKIPDALFVLQMSLATTAFSVMTIPMNGLIIAREKFFFTSLVETLCAILKLIFIITLMYYDGNRLRYYAVALAIIQFLSPLSYQIYCRINDKEIIRWKFNRCKKDYKELFSFASWILVGAMAVIGKIQGAAMIINLFFGTILNAAFGLATQVNHAVASFTSTLRQAAIPQIMMSQGGGDEERSLNLVYAMSRYSYLCMNIFAIPLLFCMDDVLKIWLGNPPEFTRVFVAFMLISGMVSNLGAGFDASIQATGKIRKNQIGFSIINLLYLPLIFLLYKWGLPPYANVICLVIVSFATLIFQVNIMTELTSFKVRKYVRETIFPSIYSTLFSVLPLFGIRMLFSHTVIATFIFVVVAMVWICVSIYLWGLNIREKTIIKNIIINKTKTLYKW